MFSKIRLEVICVGNELLYDRINTDVNLLSAIMAKAGLKISRCVTVPDIEDEIIASVRECLEMSDILILTGGLGPTSDDITKEALAKFLGRKLVYSGEIWQGICERFARRGILPSETNKKQAYVIEGSEVLDNPVGTAPGLLVQEREKKIALFPGPPVELKPMAENFTQRIRDGKETPLEINRYGLYGMGESAVEEKVNPFMRKIETPYTILASPQMIEILVTSECPRENLQRIGVFLKDEFGNSYAGINPPSLPEMLGSILKEKDLRISLAESCTGGLASKLLTDVPGSSAYFQGSFVAYSNSVKKKTLGVPGSILRKYGAVSPETATSMAKGAKKKGKADVSISFTGIAGPSGATATKPMGLVYIGIGLPRKKTEVYRFIFTGNRERIREQAVYKGFDLLVKLLREGHVKK